MPEAPDICPNCGAEVPPGDKACPECGADDQTGWSDQARCNSLDLPDQDFDYEDYVQHEFGREKPIPRGIHWVWWLVALGLAVSLAFFWL